MSLSYTVFQVYNNEYIVARSYTNYKGFVFSQPHKKAPYGLLHRG